MTVFNDRVVLYASKNNDVDLTAPLLEFNTAGTGMAKWGCDAIIGWRNTASLDAVLTSFGSGNGAWAANRFPAKEKYITVEGWCQSASRALSEINWDNLVNAFPEGAPFYLVRYEIVPKMARVRLYDAIEYPQDFEQEFRFSVPLVIESGVKESLALYSDFVNVFAGGLVYRTWTGQTNGDTNWILNSSFEVDVTSGVYLFSGASVTRVTTPTPANGTYAARVVTSTTATSGIGLKTSPVTPNGWDPVIWNGTLSLRGNAGGEIVETWLRFFYTNGTISDTPHIARTLTTTYQNFTHTGEPDDYLDVDYMEVHARAPGTTSITFFIDRVHVNAAPSPTPFFNGATSGSSFWTGSAHVTPSSTQANPKAPGRRSWSGYTRTWTVGSLASQGVIERALVRNAGTTVSYPISQVTGPLFEDSWEIRNDTTGERLTFRVDVPEGVTLEIDHENQTAIMNGQHIEYLKDGTWWGLVKGTNQLRLAADDYNDSASALFLHRDTWRN